MKVTLMALLGGVTFGFGLSLSQMTDPARVLGFLDVAGRWDPTLAFVMAGALALAIPAFRFLPRLERPRLTDAFRLPTRRDLDGRLIAGAMAFGAGWGLSGLCPGPAVTDLASGVPAVFGFVAAMLAGRWLAGRLLPG